MSESTHPETVNFISEGVECVAAVIFKKIYTFNMRSCQITFKEKPNVNIEYIGDRVRVLINDGAIWFDTDELSAAKIEQLIELGE